MSTIRAFSFLALPILFGCTQGDICDSNAVNKVVYGPYKKGARIQCEAKASIDLPSSTPDTDVKDPVEMEDGYVLLREATVDLAKLDKNGKYRLYTNPIVTKPIPTFNGEIDLNGFTINIESMPLQAGDAGVFADLGPNAYIHGGTVYVTGAIEGNGNVGVISGVNRGGTIEDLVVIADIVKTYGNATKSVGGAVGFNNSGTLRRVSIQGANVQASGQASVGGLVGSATAALGKKGLVTNSDFGGSVTGLVNTGGVVGKAFDTDLISITLVVEYVVPQTSITTVGYIAGVAKEQNYSVTIQDCTEVGPQAGHPYWLPVFGQAVVTTISNASVQNP